MQAIASRLLSLFLAAIPVSIQAADTPVISPLADVAIEENSATDWLPFVLYDSETGGGLSDLGAVSSNPDLLPNTGIETGGAGTNWLIRLRPLAHHYGTATVTLYATNEAGAFASRAFHLTVTYLNEAPTIAPIPDVSVQEDIIIDFVSYSVGDRESAAQLLQVTAHSSNPDLIPDGNITVIRAGLSGLLKLVPLTNAFGTASITVTVRDTDGASSSTAFQYTVEPVNDPPTLDALADLSIAQNAGAQSLPLMGISPGADNELQTVTITAFANPPGILTNLQVSYTSPADSGTLSFETVNDASGDALVTVYVEDGQVANNVTARSFTVHVNRPNQLPVISAIPDQWTDMNVPKAIPFTASDAETAPQSLVLSATSSNPTLVPQNNIVFVSDEVSRTVTITPASGQYGTALITITCADAAGDQASKQFLFTVRQDTVLPTILSQPQSQTVAAGGTVTCTVEVSGAEPLTYQWQHDGTPLPGNTSPTLVLANVQPSDAGDYTLVIGNGSSSVTSAAAHIRILLSPDVSHITKTAAGTRLSFSSAANQNYTLEYKNAITDATWRVLETKLGTGSLLEFEDPSAKMPTRFYRLRVD